MKQVTIQTILLVFVLGFISCDRPNCTNTNQVFESNNPESKHYKDELVKQLKNIDQTKLRYWLQKYEERNGKEFLHFNIQNDGLCAIIVLRMSTWEKLENLRKEKGVSYRGAEFVNLKFETQTNNSSTQFIYKSFDRIID